MTKKFLLTIQFKKTNKTAAVKCVFMNNAGIQSTENLCQ